jgi:hypothetical protein
VLEILSGLQVGAGPDRESAAFGFLIAQIYRYADEEPTYRALWYAVRWRVVAVQMSTRPTPFRFACREIELGPERRGASEHPFAHQLLGHPVNRGGVEGVEDRFRIAALREDRPGADPRSRVFSVSLDVLPDLVNTCLDLRIGQCVVLDEITVFLEE